MRGLWDGTAGPPYHLKIGFGGIWGFPKIGATTFKGGYGGYVGLYREM